MAVWIAFALQAVAGPPGLPPSPKLRAAPRCTPDPDAAPDDVVVCGRRDEPYRLKPLPELYVTPDRLPKAEADVGVGKLAVETEQGSDAQGGAIPRAMVRLKIPL